eukprot:TRINITY_DN2608_c0_g3_i1.p1 TRINITY_DN2608_c0_g3~~TRINITY_DN2608_c0_g3_i1.p1  ORF type:complete len:175 (+),score=28.43 TRINITY_DN2608_c0_g3_i1:82-606(+)
MGSSESRKKKIVIIGLDNAGKTTLINSLKSSKVTDIVPTVSCSTEHFEKNKINFTVFDMSGHSEYRFLWEKYYSGCNAVIFVVDSGDSTRMHLVKNELQRLLAHPTILAKGMPILFYANKMDLESAYAEEEVAKVLDLDGIKDRPWNIFASNALTYQGVEEGINWLSEKLLKKK